MARQSKRQLLNLVERAIRDSGWGILHLSAQNQHPARYQIYRQNKGFRIKVYIWNVSHGGGAGRAANEYRIQITGVTNEDGFPEIVPETNGKTLILGWWDEIGIFVGFDFKKRGGLLGASPSIQVSENALRKAHLGGFSPHNKGNGELAIAFRPNFISEYIENLEILHRCGESPAAIEKLGEIGSDAEHVGEDEITRDVPAERRYAVISTKKALRDISFRDRVLNAYGYQCAFCGVQLRLLDAAHVLPVPHPESTDDTNNGVSLCTLHHRAYDRSFITFDGDYNTHLNENMAEEFRQSGDDGGLEAFRANLRPMLILPPDRRDRPKETYIATVNGLRGWAL